MLKRSPFDIIVKSYRSYFESRQNTANIENTTAGISRKKEHHESAAFFSITKDTEEITNERQPDPDEVAIAKMVEATINGRTTDPVLQNTPPPPPPEMTTPEVTSASTGTAIYIVVGAFGEKGNARKLMRQLQSKSLAGKVLPKNGDLWRVGIRYPSKKAAEKHLRMVRNTVNDKAWIL